MQHVTELLKRMSAGDPSAADQLMPLVYADLRIIAKTRMARERGDHTLQPTALVNEAYLRLFANSPPSFTDRAHFMAAASHVMRHILVDYARACCAAKRGSGEGPAKRSEIELGGRAGDLADLLDVNYAIEALAAKYPEPAQSIEMHFFGGMTAEEISAATGRPANEVRHDLRFGRAHLRRRLAVRPSRASKK